MHHGRRAVVASARSILGRVVAAHVHRGRAALALLLQPALAERVLVRVRCIANWLGAEDPAVALGMGLAFGAAICRALHVLVLVEAPIPRPRAIVIGMELGAALVGRRSPPVPVIAERVDDLTRRCRQPRLLRHHGLSRCSPLIVSLSSATTLLPGRGGGQLDEEQEEKKGICTYVVAEAA